MGYSQSGVVGFGADNVCGQWTEYAESMNCNGYMDRQSELLRESQLHCSFISLLCNLVVGHHFSDRQTFPSILGSFSNTTNCSLTLMTLAGAWRLAETRLQCGVCGYCDGKCGHFGLRGGEFIGSRLISEHSDLSKLRRDISNLS